MNSHAIFALVIGALCFSGLMTFYLQSQVNNLPQDSPASLNEQLSGPTSFYAFKYEVESDSDFETEPESVSEYLREKRLPSWEDRPNYGDRRPTLPAQQTSDSSYKPTNIPINRNTEPQLIDYDDFNLPQEPSAYPYKEVRVPIRRGEEPKATVKFYSSEGQEGAQEPQEGAQEGDQEPTSKYAFKSVHVPIHRNVEPLVTFNDDDVPHEYSIVYDVDESDNQDEIDQFDDDVQAAAAIEVSDDEPSTSTPASSSEIPKSNYEKIMESNPYKKLGLYETMPKEYYNMSPKSKLYKKQRYYALKRNPNYCEQVDMYNLYHPENIFGESKFVTDYAGDEALVRKYVMPKFGKDMLPQVRGTMPISRYGKSLYTLPINATMYFFKRVNVHHYYEINKQMFCLSQMYNHIPGHGVLTRKDLVMDSIKDYMKKYEKKPQCIKENIYFPAAYRLNNADECKQFFEEINSEEFQKRKETEPIPFIIKVGFGAHRARGLALFNGDQEANLKRRYANGAYCGKLAHSLVAQKYISNPLLLDKQNKFDFRIYMLVASVNPLIVYYHDGFLRVSLSQYDKFSNQTNVHFTNTHLSKKIFAEARKHQQYEGMTEKELREYQMWSMEDLQDYLLEIGKINNTNWLAEQLRPKFQEAYIHLVRMAEHSFYKSSSVFELYGLDFVIDENLDIWFIECNASPQLVGTNPRKAKFLGQMLMDMFELQNAYLKSRMKRVFLFMKKMQTFIQDGNEVDYAQMRQEFDQINTNKFEPEVKIRPNNGFTLIMDRNLEGADAYFGHLREECVDFE